jgi:DNA transformation protein
MNDAGFVAHCLELLSAAGPARSRRMFGGHGMYVDNLFVALVIGDRLYLKADVASQPAFAAEGCEPFVYDGAGKAVTLSYWSAPAEAMESPALMLPWVRRALQAALAARAAAPVKRRTTKGAVSTAAAPAAPGPRRRRGPH